MARWRRYVPVAQRQANAQRQVGKRLSKGEPRIPVRIEGRAIAQSFWGKAWCKHLESYSDYSNRLPRGRNYVRNGSVVHLDIKAGRIEAYVAGSSLYTITISIKPLSKTKWMAIKQQAAGGISSMIELLQGKFSDEVMRVVTDPDEGLFPKPGEISLHCSCPDWAEMCKHVAAAVYGVGNRLDTRPDLLFLLRRVDPEELLAARITLPTAQTPANTIPDDALSALFGIALETSPPSPATRAKTPVAPQAGAPQKQSRSAAIKQPTPTKIRRLRKKLGLSSAALAARLGVSEASVNRWENATGTLKLQSRPLAALIGLMEESK